MLFFKEDQFENYSMVVRIMIIALTITGALLIILSIIVVTVLMRRRFRRRVLLLKTVITYIVFDDLTMQVVVPNIVNVSLCKM